MKLESAIASINRLLRETAKTFSLQSMEYQRMKYLVESIDKNIDLFTKTDKGTPLKVSRSKTALKGLAKYQKQIEDTLQVMREGGTVLEMAKLYDKTMTASRLKKPIDANRIRHSAVARAAENNMIPDWYSSISEIHDAKLQTAARNMFRNPNNLKGDAWLKHCDDAIEFVRLALMDEAAALKQLDLSKSRILGSDVTLAEALAQQK